MAEQDNARISDCQMRGSYTVANATYSSHKNRQESIWHVLSCSIASHQHTSMISVLGPALLDDEVRGLQHSKNYCESCHVHNALQAQAVGLPDRLILARERSQVK